jgi:ABC-type amino acid transport substrate-binding protein
MMNQAKCTTCGAGLTIRKGDKTCVCEYCQSTNIVENALALGKVEVDVTEDIKKLRANLTTFVQQNSIDEILRVSQKLLDWIPQDFVALYFFGYAKQQQNQPRFFYDLLNEPGVFVEEELQQVVNHILRYSELRDKARIVSFLDVHAPNYLSQYLQVHKERENQEDNYANIPRDVFVCFSSFDLDVAEAVVKELEADGNTCWISTRNLRPEDAENYWKNIENAIQNSKLFIVISSADSMRSKDVHKEIEFAQIYKSRMIVFKIDGDAHNTLFKHVFDGNKWIQGKKIAKQSYKAILQRVYEEKSLVQAPTEETSFTQVFRTSKNKLVLGSLFSVLVIAVAAFFMLVNREIDVSLNGATTLIVPAGESYFEFGAQATNSRNESFPVEIIGSVDVMTPGTYFILYRATDRNGNVFETERSVQVVDTLAPEVSLIGASTKELLVGDLFNDPGSSALDNVDGVVDVIVRGQVDTTNPGTYQIEYSAVDNAGNRSTILTRTVLVRIPTIEDLVIRSFTVITMDMNPTVAIFLDSTDRVIGVRALNEDANDIVKDYSYVNQNVEQVLEAIISRSKDYLNNDEVILIGVQSTSESKQSIIADRLERRITQLNVSLPQNIQPIIRRLDLNPSVLRAVLRQEVPTQARQDYVRELIEVGRVPENANQIINRPIREIEAQRVASRVDEILNDKIPPQIRLQGIPNQNISLNGTYVEFGATVTDNLENDLEVTITGTVDTSRPGVYELVYTARDSAGNEATPVTRRVTVGSVSSGGAPSTGGSTGGDFVVPTTPTTPTTPTKPTTPTTPTTPTPNEPTPPLTDPDSDDTVPLDPTTPVTPLMPEIMLIGESELNHLIGTPYVSMGAMGTDSIDGKLDPVQTGNVDIQKEGTYEITYFVVNSRGNRAEVKRTIHVVKPVRIELFDELFHPNDTARTVDGRVRRREVNEFQSPPHITNSQELMGIYITVEALGSSVFNTYRGYVSLFINGERFYFEEIACATSCLLLDSYDITSKISNIDKFEIGIRFHSQYSRGANVKVEYEYFNKDVRKNVRTTFESPNEIRENLFDFLKTYSVENDFTSSEWVTHVTDFSFRASQFENKSFYAFYFDNPDSRSSKAISTAFPLNYSLGDTQRLTFRISILNENTLIASESSYFQNGVALSRRFVFSGLLEERYYIFFEFDSSINSFKFT